MIIEAALIEELVMHSLVMITISGGVVVKRKYITGYHPKLLLIKRKRGVLNQRIQNETKKV